MLELPRLTADDRERFDNYHMPVPESGCWLWTGSAGRYGCFHTSRCVTHLGRKYEMSHRVSYELHYGPIPPGLCVRHKCDVTLCVNPYHLELGTQSDNMRDRSARGRYRNGREKLTPLQIEVARALRSSGLQVKQIAAQLGVSRSHASRVTAGCQPKWRIKCQP